MNEPHDARSDWPQYIICYASLAVMAAISIWLLQALVQAITLLGLVLEFNRYAMTALNQWSFVLLGILWLITLFWVEHYLRAGVHNGNLWSRVGKVFAWELGLLVIALILQSLPVV